MIPTLVTLYGDDRRVSESGSMGFLPIILKAAQVGAKVGVGIGKRIAKKVKAKRKAKRDKARAASAARAAAAASVPAAAAWSVSPQPEVSPPAGATALPVSMTADTKRYLMYGGAALVLILLLRGGSR